MSRKKLQFVTTAINEVIPNINARKRLETETEMTNYHRTKLDFWVCIGIALCAFLALSLGSCDEARAETGYATYYTIASCQREGTSGVFTATGERYNESALTCALPNRSFGKEYIVYGLKKGTSVAVRHNDYGPGKGPRSKGVVIDLTPTAFKEVCGDLSIGKCEVSYQEII